MKSRPLARGVAAAAIIGLGAVASAHADEAPEGAPAASAPASSVPAEPTLPAPAPEQEPPQDFGVIELDTGPSADPGQLEAVTPSPTVGDEGDKDSDKGTEESPAADTLGGDSLLDLPGIGSAVPFAIQGFRIPLFLLPIYQAAGIEYGVRWEILAAINEIETDYGRNLNVSSAGAMGWMQFMPPTWRAMGVDANRDGRRDPYDPVDAIFSAARYLDAAGIADDLRAGIFAYNRADWYVDDVLARARLIAALPEPLVGSLTGMADGLFPVHAPAHYRAASTPLRPGGESTRTAAGDVTWADISAADGAPVVAVQNGKILRMGQSKRLGNFIELRDAYGTTYTYAQLGEIADRYPQPRERTASEAEVLEELGLPSADRSGKSAPKRRGPRRGTATVQGPRPLPAQSVLLRRALGQSTARVRQVSTDGAATGEAVVPAAPADSLSGVNLVAAAARGGLAALGLPPGSAASAGVQAALPDSEKDADPVVPAEADGANYTPQVRDLLGLSADDVRWRNLRVGSTVIAGTVLGSLSGDGSARGRMRFAVRPVGQGAPQIDPRPLLDGWRMLERSRLFRVRGRAAGVGQAMLLDRPALGRLVLSDKRITIYACGRSDIVSGQIDRRVLATLVFLADAGLRPTVTSLRCGHNVLTASGNVSQHSTGDAVDIAAINGVPIYGNQGAGSVTDSVLRRLLSLQGTMKPDQIISLMTYPGVANTYAMADHADHIHVGFRPLYGGGNDLLGAQARAVLAPGQWTELANRLRDLDQPTLGRRRDEP